MLTDRAKRNIVIARGDDPVHPAELGYLPSGPPH